MNEVLCLGRDIWSSPLPPSKSVESQNQSIKFVFYSSQKEGKEGWEDIQGKGREGGVCVV